MNTPPTVPAVAPATTTPAAPAMPVSTPGSIAVTSNGIEIEKILLAPKGAGAPTAPIIYQLPPPAGSTPAAPSPRRWSTGAIIGLVLGSLAALTLVTLAIIAMVMLLGRTSRLDERSERVDNALTTLVQGANDSSEVKRSLPELIKGSKAAQKAEANSAYAVEALNDALACKVIGGKVVCSKPATAGDLRRAVRSGVDDALKVDRAEAKEAISKMVTSIQDAAKQRQKIEATFDMHKLSIVDDEAAAE